MATYDPIPTGGYSWRYPGTQEAVQQLLPFFFNDLHTIEPNVTMTNRIVAGIMKCVSLGEQKFAQQFGGWNPKSNEFGIQVLRPTHLYNSTTTDIGGTTTRWRFTSAATGTIFWTSEDSYLASFTVSDKAILMIWGYFNLSPVPNITELFIQPGSNKLPIMNLYPLRLRKEKYFCFPQPLIIEPNSQITITCASESSSVIEETGLLGYYFAPMSRLISKELSD